MTRGGKRSGAGRKAAIDSFQALQVGEHCEALWLKAAEDQALARHAETAEMQLVDAERARLDLVHPLLRKRSALPKEIGEEITDIIGKRRGYTIAVLRPYEAKFEIIQSAIAWCKKEFGADISESKANQCWKDFRRFRKWAEKQAV